jgi:hypothetical protein
MKIITFLTIVIFLVSGCTTLRPVELSQSTLQARISSGELIRPGERVLIVTQDGKQYEFKVISIGDGYVKGKDVEIPVKDIELIEQRKVSIGKTALLLGSILLIILTAVAGGSAGADLGTLHI